MDENLHDIEDLFFSNLQDNEEEEPSQKVWEVIDMRLDKDNIIVIKKKYTNAKRLAGILLLLLSGLIVYEMYRTNNVNNGISKINDTQIENKQTQAPLLKGHDADAMASTGDSLKSNAEARNNYIDTGYTKIINEDTFESKTTKNHLVRKFFASKEEMVKYTASENFAGGKNKKRDGKGKSKIHITSPAAVQIDDSATLKDIAANEMTSPEGEIKKSENIITDPTEEVATVKKSTLQGTSHKIFDTVKTAVAKTAPQQKIKLPRFSITPFFSPDIPWYHLQNDRIANQPESASSFTKEEKHELSFSFGAVVDYRFNKHWTLQSGLSFSNTNIVVDPKTIYAQQDNQGNIKYRINTSSGYGYLLPSFVSNPSVGDSLNAFTSAHSLQYFIIPVSLKYGISKRRFDFNIMAGLSANILTRAKLETIIGKGNDNSFETVDNLQGLKKVCFSGLAGIGAEYKASPKIGLVFDPVIRFALNSINQGAPVKSYPLSFGFRMGLKIKI